MPARLPVAGHRQRPTLAPDPRLAQRVRQQRQGTGLALHLADEHLDEPRLQQQPVLPGRRLDRRSQVLVVHRAQQVETPLDESGERWVGGEVAEAVGAQGHDERRVRSVCSQRVEERRPLGDHRHRA